MIPKESQIHTYDYILPKRYIADSAAHPAESAKMLSFCRDSGEIQHEYFSDFPAKLGENSLLFLNDTRVIPSRVHFLDTKFITSGSEKIRSGEIFFLETLSPKVFKAMIFPGKYFKEGTRIEFPGYTIEVKSCIPEGRILEIIHGKDISHFLQEFGKLPLPPYVEYTDEKAKDYQTSFAKHDGSLAAPTASLHFSPSLMEQIYKSGAEVRFLTLHVGLGTFIGMKTEDIREHAMHPEYFSLPLRTFSEIAIAKTASKRIIAVGTTVIRTLESLAYAWSCVRERFLLDTDTLNFWDDITKDIKTNPFVSDVQVSDSEVSGHTKLFITPGFRFRVVSEIVTNFHLPKSTLIVLVSAFAGIEETKRIYEAALSGNYRFYSFGDGMWVK